MVGQRLLHYDILEELGKGGMGVVYKARDTHLDRFVAIKILPPEMVADSGRRARFVREAKAASALNHPNIIVIHDISNQGAIDFLVMEYVPGQTLGNLIPAEGMPFDRVVHLGSEIAAALAAAHAAGIVHRDIKPANIMVTPQRRVKVLDFGLAKMTPQAAVDPDGETRSAVQLTIPGVVVGTISFMSPEQTRGGSAHCATFRSSRRCCPTCGWNTISTVANLIWSEGFSPNRRVSCGPGTQRRSPRH